MGYHLTRTKERRELKVDQYLYIKTVVDRFDQNEDFSANVNRHNSVKGGQPPVTGIATRYLVNSVQETRRGSDVGVHDDSPRHG